MPQQNWVQGWAPGRCPTGTGADSGQGSGLYQLSAWREGQPRPCRGSTEGRALPGRGGLGQRPSGEMATLGLSGCGKGLTP